MPEAADWDIGPVIKGRNYSVGMPPTLTERRGEPSFDFPHPSADAGHVHYVTTPVDGLAGARRMTLRYRIDAAPGTRFIAQENPAERATLSLYFQRAGDRWTRRTSTYRWYAPHARLVPLAPGVHTVSIRLDERWIAVMGEDAQSHPEAFEMAKAEAARVGFVFGSASARGHGVFATGPARFTVLDFRID